MIMVQVRVLHVANQNMVEKIQKNNENLGQGSKIIQAIIQSSLGLFCWGRFHFWQKSIFIFKWVSESQQKNNIDRRMKSSNIFINIYLPLISFDYNNQIFITLMENLHSRQPLSESPLSQQPLPCFQHALQKLDIRELYEQSQILVNSITLRNSTQTQHLTQNVSITGDQNKTRIKLKTILEVIIRRLNGITQRHPLKVFIALFSNFCYILPYMNSADFHTSFSNRFYRKLFQSLLVCYQQWRQSSTSEENGILLIRLATMLASLSKLAKDSIKINTTTILNKNKIFNQCLLKTLLSMQLISSDKLLVPYQQIINFTVKSNGNPINTQVDPILAQISYKKVIQNIFINLLENNLRLPNKISLPTLYILNHLLNRPLPSNPEKSEQLQDQLILTDQQKNKIHHFCIETISHYCFNSGTEEYDRSIVRISLSLLKFVLRENIGKNVLNEKFQVPTGWLIKLCLHPRRAQFLQTQILKYFAKCISEGEKKDVLELMIRNLSESYSAFEKMYSLNCQRNNHLLSQDFLSQLNSLKQALKILGFFLDETTPTTFFSIIYNSSDPKKSSSSSSTPTYFLWNMFNKMFKLFLRFQKTLTRFQQQTPFSCVISLMNSVLDRSSVVPQLLFILKSHFLQINFSGVYQSGENKLSGNVTHQDHMIFQEILLEYRVKHLKGQIFMKLHGRVHPEIEELEKNGLFLKIKDFLTCNNLLGSNQDLSEKFSSFIRPTIQQESIRLF